MDSKAVLSWILMNINEKLMNIHKLLEKDTLFFSFASVWIIKATQDFLKTNDNVAAQEFLKATTFFNAQVGHLISTQQSMCFSY